MSERDLAKLAAQVAAGLIAEDELLELLGEESLVNDVIAMSGALAVTTVAKNVIDDTVDTAFDVVDSINPFKW